MGKDFNHVHHLSVEKLTEMQVFFCVLKYIQHDKG